MSFLARPMSMFFLTLILLLLSLCTQLCSATAYVGGPGSFYSYTATNHLSAPPTTFYSSSPAALYKSVSPQLYSYSYLPATAVIPPPPLAFHPGVHTSVWPATAATYLHKHPANFYAPCQLKHVTSFSHVITAPVPVVPPRAPLVGKPVKTKPNNSTEHVFKPIYYPGIWGEYKPPVFSYQGTIQHGAMPGKTGGSGETTAAAVTTAKPAADSAAAAAEEEKPAEKPAEPAKAEETKEEVDEGEKEDEKADAAENATKEKKAEEIKPSKAKRASHLSSSSSSVSIAKGYGMRKNNKRRNIWNFRSA